MSKFCFCDKKTESETSMTVETGSSLILIRHIPCMECNFCGDVTFADKTSRRLEQLVNQNKTLKAELAVIDYRTNSEG